MTERNKQLEVFIDQTIKKSYEKYTADKSTASVKVTPESIEIWFNTEEPYLGNELWDFLEDVEKAICPEIEKAGYGTKHEGMFLYSMLNWHYRRFK